METEAKLNKARHPFPNEVSLNVGADFQLIPSEDARKGTKNVHPYCCGACVASEQQHNQDLKRIYKREYELSNSSLFARMQCT